MKKLLIIVVALAFFNIACPLVASGCDKPPAPPDGEPSGDEEN